MNLNQPTNQSVLEASYPVKVMLKHKPQGKNCTCVYIYYTHTHTRTALSLAIKLPVSGYGGGSCDTS